MATLTLHAGICGFSTTIRSKSDDGQNVTLEFDTECPHLQKAKGELTSVDAYAEIFAKPAATQTYAVLSKHLVHTACPLYMAFLKSIEVAAGLALPKDVTLTIQP